MPFVSLVLGLEHSCPWPRECLSSERLSLALASDFFCVLGLGLEPCVLDSTSDVRHPMINYCEFEEIRPEEFFLTAQNWLRCFDRTKLLELESEIEFLLLPKLKIVDHSIGQRSQDFAVSVVKSNGQITFQLI